MTGEQALSGVFEQVFPLAPGGRVQVQQMRGRLDIAGWDRPEVLLTARGADVARALHIHRQADRCSIEVRGGRWLLGGLLSPAVELQLKVPSTADLNLDLGAVEVSINRVYGQVVIDVGSGYVRCVDVGSVSIDCGSGHVALQGVLGRVRLDSGSGHVRLTDVRGDVRADCSAGDLHLAEIYGSVQAETGSGDIVAHAVTGETLRLETGSGAMRLTDLRVCHMALETGSGHVSVELAEVDPRGSYGLETGSGNVEVRLPADARVTVRVEGHRRQIENALPLTGVVMGDDELRGLLNGGGAALQIEAHGRVLLGACKARSQPPAPAAAPPVPVPAPQAPAAASPESVAAHPAPAPPGAEAAPAATKTPVEPAADLSEEYRRVLKMVEEGKLKPEEADAILRALEEGTEEERP